MLKLREQNSKFVVFIVVHYLFICAVQSYSHNYILIKIKYIIPYDLFQMENSGVVHMLKNQKTEGKLFFHSNYFIDKCSM